MMIKAGSTSRMVTVYLFDATTGLPYTSGAYNDAGAAFWYRRGTAGAKTTITAATQTVSGAYSSGGFVVIAENAYRFDIPDAAFASGVDEVQIGGSATAWKMLGPCVQLVGFDPRTDAVATVAGSLDVNAKQWAGTAVATPTTAGVPRVDVKAMEADVITAAAIAANAIGASEIADGAIDAATFAAGAINAAAIAADAIGASELAADAVAEIQSGLATASALTTAQADLTTLLGRLSAARAGYLDNLSAGAVATASALAAVAGKFTGITLLSEWLGALAGKQTANSTARTEIRATGAGGGTYDETTDSQEALRDRGDAAWTTGSSVLGSGSEAIRIRCLNGAAPVDGAAVWITTDSAGTNVVAGTVYTSGTGYTSTLMLDPGSYYVWRQANGVNFTNPETITVSDL